MGKTPKPVIHHRDHEHGGADVVLIEWDDCEDEPTGGGTGVNNATISATWTFTSPASGGPGQVGGTFTEGTTPGYWNTGTGASTMITYLTAGSWQINVSGTVNHTVGDSVDVAVNFAQSFGGGTAGVEIFRHVMNAGDSLPLSYSTTIDLADGTTVALPVTHWYGTGSRSTTITGLMTFTEL